MFVIGLTGNAGSGKSYVCDCALELTRCPVIDSDSVTRKLMMPGETVYRQVAEAFGPEYVLPDGTLNRPKIAAKVFADEDALRKLNELTHPATIRQIRCLIEQYEKQGYPVVFVESALAEEAGYRDFCDELWLVAAPPEVRTQRLRERGYSEERIENVTARQTPQEKLDVRRFRRIENGKKDNRFLILHQLIYLLDSSVGRAVWTRRDNAR